MRERGAPGFKKVDEIDARSKAFAGSCSDGQRAEASRRGAPGAGEPVPRLEPPRRAGLGISLGFIGSALLHLGLVALIGFAASKTPKPAERAPTLVEVDIVHQASPAPEPPPVREPEVPAPEKEPPPPPKPKPKPKPRPKPVAENLPPPPKEAPPPKPDVDPDAPPPPNDAVPQGASPKAPVRIGISLSSTSSAGSFAASVGNTLYGAAPKVATAPEEVKPYAPPPGGRYVPQHRVATLPRLSREVRAVYPEEARRLGLEGQVVLRLKIGADGDVLAVKVLHAAGHGFDEAAIAAVKQFKFEPGTEGGEAVATDITYTYTFLLD